MFSLFILLALSAPLALAQRDGISYDTYSDESVSASRYDSDNCESNSYSVYGYLSNNEQRMITIEASYNNYCDDYDYISYYACANLRVPKKATWTREGNRVTVKASATLKDCGYYSSDGGGDNPFAGSKVSVDVEIYCKVLDTSKSACQNRYTNRRSFETGRNQYSSAYCYVDGKVGTFKIDGKTINLTSGSFGESKSSNVDVRIPRPRLA